MKKKMPEMYEKYLNFKFRYKKFKSLFDNKQSNFHLKITQSERILFEKLSIEADEEVIDYERKPRRYRHRESPSEFLPHDKTMTKEKEK